MGACVSGVRADFWKSEGAPTYSNKALLSLLLRGRNERTGSCDFCLLSCEMHLFSLWLTCLFPVVSAFEQGSYFGSLLRECKEDNKLACNFISQFLLGYFAGFPSNKFLSV